MVSIDDQRGMALGGREFRIKQGTVKKPWLFVVLPGAGENDSSRDSVCQDFTLLLAPNERLAAPKI